jgi:hypothetical protein
MSFLFKRKKAGGTNTLTKETMKENTKNRITEETIVKKIPQQRLEEEVKFLKLHLKQINEDNRTLKNQLEDQKETSYKNKILLGIKKPKIQNPPKTHLNSHIAPNPKKT